VFYFPLNRTISLPGGPSIVETLRVIKLHMAETLEAFKSVFKRLSLPGARQVLPRAVRRAQEALREAGHPSAAGAPCPWSSDTAT